jgi:hypothetical protein
MVQAAGAGGEVGAIEPAPFLVAVVGRSGNAIIEDDLILAFADYAGLEAEWADGTATTVLVAAIDAAMAGKAAVDYGLTAAQRSLLGVTVEL